MDNRLCEAIFHSTGLDLQQSGGLRAHAAIRGNHDMIAIWKTVRNDDVDLKEAWSDQAAPQYPRGKSADRHGRRIAGVEGARKDQAGRSRSAEASLSKC